MKFYVQREYDDSLTLFVFGDQILISGGLEEEDLDDEVMGLGGTEQIFTFFEGFLEPDADIGCDRRVH